jgi:hypothetical protein
MGKPGLSLTRNKRTERDSSDKTTPEQRIRATEKTRVSWSVFDPRQPDVYYSVSRWIDGLGPAKTSVPNDA